MKAIYKDVLKIVGAIEGQRKPRAENDLSNAIRAALFVLCISAQPTPKMLTRSFLKEVAF